MTFRGWRIPIKNTKHKVQNNTITVLIIVQNLSVPSDVRVWNEAIALQERGFKVIVLCPKGKKRDTKSREDINGISIYRYSAYTAKSGTISYFWEYTQAIICITLMSLYLFVKHGFDVIHICNPPDLLFMAIWPYKLLGRKMIFDHHDLCPELYSSKFGGQNGLVLKTLYIAEKITFKLANVVLSTNNSFKKIAISRGCLSQDRVFVVRNGPRLSTVKNSNINKKEIRDSKQTLFYVGSIAEQDGVDYLLRSIHYIVNKYNRNDFKILIVGDGPALHSLEILSKELKIDDLITFNGYIPHADVFEKIAIADICICPDPKTTMNDISTTIKVMEYMAMGKPIVAFDLIETKVSAGEAALYAKPNDEKDFAEKIIQLLDSQELRKKLGEIGKERVHNGLSWEHSKEHLYRAYDYALSEN